MTHGKNLVAISTLRFRGLTDGTSQDGLKQNAPFNLMRLDICNVLRKDNVAYMH